ncbi:MAG: hypothetical protein JXX14_23260 [Deltaproteobacteria bacterium]|nr:hypothetical protein [Deltaproteobacteria bacterium]
MRHKRVIVTSAIVGIVVGVYLLAMIPDGIPSVKVAGQGEAFAWNQNAYWATLEKRFVQQRQQGCGHSVPEVAALLDDIRQQLDGLNSAKLAYRSDSVVRMERAFYDAAVKMGRVQRQ